MSRIVAYVRVSSRGQNFELQHGSIEKEARARGLAIDEVFAEKRSATTMRRPELDRLRAEVRHGRVSSLLVFKLDRLTRSGVQDTFALVKELREAGVTLIAPGDNLTLRPDSNDVASECYVFALGLAARLEHAARRDRIAAARERAESQGRPWGRPSRMDPDLVARARALRAEGRSFRSIAMALRTPLATVARACRNPDRSEPRRNAG